MANRQRTYQWVNGRIQDFCSHADIEIGQETSRLAMGLQAWLLLFTLSSVLAVFAGLGLFAFGFAVYAFIFG